MIGEVVLLYESVAVAESPVPPVPAIVTGVRTGDDGGQALELAALSTAFGVELAPAPTADDEPSYGDVVRARAVIAPRGQPGKDSGTFWAPRG